MNRRTVVVATAVVTTVVIGLLTGCTRDVDVPASFPAIQVGASQGAGQPIAGGLVVADGSTMLGPAFPGPAVSLDGGLPPAPVVRCSGVGCPTVPGSTSTTTTTMPPPPGTTMREWTALVRIDGNPGAVFDAYVHQFERLGIALRPEFNLCTPVDRDDVDALRITMGDLRGQSRRDPIGCVAFSGYQQGKPHGEIQMFTTGVGPKATWNGWIILSIAVVDGGAPHRVAPVDLSADLIGDRSTALPAVGLQPPPPGRGDRFAPPGVFVVGELRVPVGVAPVAPTVGSTNWAGGWTALVRLTGDPEKAIAALIADREPPQPDRRETVDGVQVIERGWDSAGGDKLDVTAVRDRDGHWYALLDASTDP